MELLQNGSDDHQDEEIRLEYDWSGAKNKAFKPVHKKGNDEIIQYCRNVCSALSKPHPLHYLSGNDFAEGDWRENAIENSNISTICVRSVDDSFYIIAFRVGFTQPLYHTPEKIITVVHKLCTRILKENPNRIVILSGMGISGHIAINIALRFVEQKEFRIRCVTFGSPPLEHMTEEVCKRLQPEQFIPYFLHVCHPDDQLPTVIAYLYKLQDLVRSRDSIEVYIEALMCWNYDKLISIVNDNLATDKPTRVIVGHKVLVNWARAKQEHRYDYEEDLPLQAIESRTLHSLEWRVRVSNECIVRECDDVSTVSLQCPATTLVLTVIDQYGTQAALHHFPHVTFNKSFKIGAVITMQCLFHQVEYKVMQVTKEPSKRAVIATLSRERLYTRGIAIREALRSNRLLANSELYKQLCDQLTNMEVLCSVADHPAETRATLIEQCSRVIPSNILRAMNELQHTSYLRKAGAVFSLVISAPKVVFLTMSGWLSNSNSTSSVFCETYIDALREEAKYLGVNTFEGVGNEIPFLEERIYDAYSSKRFLSKHAKTVMNIFGCTVRLREIQEKILLIGVLGRKSQGKTVFIERTFDVNIRGEAGAGSHRYTTAPQIYCAPDLEGCLVMDLPGTDEADRCALESMSKALYMPDVFIVLIEGSEKTGVKKDRTHIHRIIRLGVPYLICFTKMDRAGPNSPIFQSEQTLQNHYMHLIKDLVGDGKVKITVDNRKVWESSPIRQLLKCHDNVWLTAFAPDPERKELVERFPSILGCNDVYNWIKLIHSPLNKSLREECIKVKWDPRKTVVSSWFEHKLQQLQSSVRLNGVEIDRAAVYETMGVLPKEVTQWGFQYHHDKPGVDALHNSCDMELFADAHDCWKTLHTALEDARSLIWICGWDFNPHLNLDRSDLSITLGSTLIRKANERVDVRVMLWKPPFMNPTITMDQVENYFGDSCVKLIHSSTPLDVTEWVSFSASHHQKIILCDIPRTHTNGRVLVAYVGGIDLAVGRYDTPAHPIAPLNSLDYIHDWYCPEQNEDPKVAIPQQRQPWHDIHCRLRGPVVADVFNTYKARWEADSKRVVPTEWVESLIERCKGYHWSAQIFRSTPKRVLSLKQDETGIHAAYVQAIKSAQRFIYIENQFFISKASKAGKKNKYVSNTIAKTLVEKITEKILSGDSFHVFLIIPLYPETNFTNNQGRWSGPSILKKQFTTLQYIMKSIQKVIDEYQKTHPHFDALVTDYFSVFSLCQADPPDRNMIYVHSKLAIFDDEYVIVGSANINERSLGGDQDTEICVGAFETDHELHPICYGHIRDFRRQLFLEHLGGIAGLTEAKTEEERMQPAMFDRGFIRGIQKVAKENWGMYEMQQPLLCHLVQYPIEWDGKILIAKSFPTSSFVNKKIVCYYANGEEKST